MSLFQPSVLKKYLSQQDSALIQKAYKKYVKYFHNGAIQENIRNSKEEQFQEGFLRELFVDILGYTLNPAANFNLTTELKNIKGAKKVDGAILKDGNALGVIELKGTNTKDLESIRQQAFDYKANQTGCIYVITSNFEKLRFYINNAVDFEEFNLFTLTHSEFEIFYLCLAKENILANKPLSIKEASVVEEENITKKFYGDYSVFKRELYRDLVKQNRANILLNDLTEKTTKLILFKKSQKLIDRFLFILFAEDRGLLAPNSINTVLKEWKALADLDVEVPLYDRYKQYFGYLDTGRKGTDKKEEIFAYNGGLFQADTILDAVIIDNDLLYRHTLKLSTYDFESQVDVNILGHIFEHSLNEIESVNAEIEGIDFDKQKTKRKKDGVFYTPKYITKYIVDNTIGKLCTEKKQELGIIDEEYAKGRKNRQTATIVKLDQQLKDYREWLLELTICDPACGSGAFLNQALDFLIREHAYLDELNKQLFGGFFVFPDIENQILEHNIYGVDLNEESIEIAKLSLWLRTAQPKRKLTSLNNNIKCGNSLIESKAVAGDKAFNWKEQFPEVFARGGFDVIIGNPPYVDIKVLEKNVVEYFFKDYKTANNRINLFSLFIEKSCQILKENAKFSFIIPSSLLTQDSYKLIRNVLLTKTNINNIVRLPNESFGGSAGEVKVDTIILTFTVTNILRLPVEIMVYKGFDRINEISSINCDEHSFIDQSLWKEDENYIFRINGNQNISKLLDKIEKKSTSLINCAEFCLGLTPYDKYKGHTPDQIINRVFHSTYQKDETFKKLLAGNGVTRYNIEWNGEEWISYGNWLGAKREDKFFKEKRILVKQIIDWSAKKIWAGITSEELYNTQNAFNLIAKKNYNTEYLLVLINSNLMSFYHRKKFLEEYKDRFQKILIKDCKEFQIPPISMEQQQPFVEKANKILSLNKDFQGVNRKFNSYFSGQYKLEKLPKKLENWSELTFADFITELTKAIKKTGLTQLTKKDEFEWLDLFEENKAKAQILKVQIETTEKAIDKMVYELYGLSEEEIGIVEGN
ncbi:Eco57I restriction-modification methylase domain-containing protein [Flavobacterium sandaracinum]|uniref:site-specific DNA-methyltransferase (adenine-specific) n=1 Tax=Flavobacterium sandaracinum TaxID=2541733 RepID=A0A4V2Z1A3_9FLAO|nr:N-6 DNA methylase [Flavobacterium sandaracinum]TDE04218.1 restriction endonuclease subunit M [Flavobacterium sandaracinum]